MENLNLTIKQINQSLLKKEFSATELTQFYLNQIKEKDKEINAFIIVVPELAISQAKKIDEKIKKNEKISVLAGIPIAVKDNILIENIKCTAASKILENYIAVYDAFVIKKLKKHDVIFLGKTNLDEFAMGSSTENSSFFSTKNPNDLSRSPGGSSGGSAAAVAANMCCAALGSDTGGSIRQPASFCGVVGFKPSYGAVSRYGLVAFASSFDVIGVIAKNTQDVKIIFNIIKGKDEMDSTSIELNSKQNTDFFTNLRIGIPKEYFIKGIDPVVEELIKKAIKKYEELGAKIEEISLPHTEYALACYYIITTAEASSNLSRYDGIKYGKSKKLENLLDIYFQNRGEGFGQEVKRRIMQGTHCLSSGYYDAYYLRAQKVRTMIKRDFEKNFEKVDIILTPVSPVPAFKLGEKINDPLKMYLSDVFTVSVNLAGLPAISIPCGRIGNLPVGFQIIGKPLEDEKILEIAERFEKY